MARFGPLLRFLVAASLLFLSFPMPKGQDLSNFLTVPPSSGAWAKYRIVTESGTKTTTKPFELAVTGTTAVQGETYIVLEAGPTKFAGFKDGVLRLSVKASPSEEEAANPFLQALAVAYQEPKGEPFLLSKGAMDTLHERAAAVKTDRKVFDLPPESAATVRGKTFDCLKKRIVTSVETKYLMTDYKSVEDGVYWLSDKTPFRIVKAVINKVETKDGKEKRKQVTVLLKEADFSGAKTRFSRLPTKERGVLGLLFH